MPQERGRLVPFIIYHRHIYIFLHHRGALPRVRISPVRRVDHRHVHGDGYTNTMGLAHCGNYSQAARANKCIYDLLSAKVLVEQEQWIHSKSLG